MLRDRFRIWESDGARFIHHLFLSSQSNPKLFKEHEVDQVDPLEHPTLDPTP